MNKEIDCSKCEFHKAGLCKTYTTNDCTKSSIYSNACKNNPTCYFKQLARKEEELDKLKKEYGILLASKNTIADIARDLQQQNQVMREAYSIWG